MAGLLFARVVQRRGWDVELIDAARQAEPDTVNLPDRDSALAHARAQDPAWIEVGEVVPAVGATPQHHRWTTYRRLERGKYAPSALGWGGAIVHEERA